MTPEDKPRLANAALDAMRANPLIVGVLLLNLLFVGVSAWTQHEHSDHLRLILDRCLPQIERKQP